MGETSGERRPVPEWALADIEETRGKLFSTVAILLLVETVCAPGETNIEHFPAIVADIAEALRGLVQKSLEELDELRIGHERRPEETASAT